MEKYGPLLNFHLRMFWLDFVVPALRDWRGGERNHRFASITLRELDAFAEHVLRFENPKSRSIDSAREELRAIEPAIGIIRDLHDTHKHGVLNRRSAKISTLKKPYNQFIGPLGTAPFGSMPLGALTVLVRVRDDSGKSILIPDIIDRGYNYWRRYLEKNGLLMKDEAVVKTPKRFGAQRYFRK